MPDLVRLATFCILLILLPHNAILYAQSEARTDIPHLASLTGIELIFLGVQPKIQPSYPYRHNREILRGCEPFGSIFQFSGSRPSTAVPLVQLFCS